MRYHVLENKVSSGGMETEKLSLDLTLQGMQSPASKQKGYKDAIDDVAASTFVLEI